MIKASKYIDEFGNIRLGVNMSIHESQMEYFDMLVDNAARQIKAKFKSEFGDIQIITDKRSLYRVIVK